MTREDNSKEDWENIFNELYDLREEFIPRRNKHRNDFRFNTEYLENEKRKREIIYRSVQLIQNNSELNNLIFSQENNNYESENERDNHIAHMEARGFWVESNYSSYIREVLNYLKNKFD